jgi:hypothetical protein
VYIQIHMLLMLVVTLLLFCNKCSSIHLIFLCVMCRKCMKLIFNVKVVFVLIFQCLVMAVKYNRFRRKLALWMRIMNGSKFI